jgi:hypothetical protein
MKVCKMCYYDVKKILSTKSNRGIKIAELNADIEQSFCDFFVDHITTFCNLEAKRAQKGSKNEKTNFFNESHQKKLYFSIPV